MDGSSRAPVDAVGGPGQEILVDQVAPQCAVIVGDLLEHLVDRRLGVLATRLERLDHLVQQQTAPRAVGRHDRDTAVPDEGTELLRRIGEDIDHKNSMNRPWPSAHLSYGQHAGQTVAFRG
jgi:hypothetical protein